jgi:hypothetical protein
MNLIERSVWYAFASTPQHIPLALLERMPPIRQVWMEAGSGPILVPCGSSARLTWPPMTPACTRTARPCSSTSTAPNAREKSTSRPSLTACPERLVPAARKVIGRPSSAESAKSAITSPSDSGSTMALGTSR